MWDATGKKGEKSTRRQVDIVKLIAPDLLTFKEWLAFFAVVPVLVVIKIMSPIVIKSLIL